MIYNYMLLVSACLGWIKCRYNWTWYEDENVVKLLEKWEAIAVCPEQWWWLPTPRDPAEIIWDNVITIRWEDITNNVKRWVEEVLKLWKIMSIKWAILKSKSPSCWSSQIFDWTFSGTLKTWDWLLAKALKEIWIEVVAENESSKFLKW